ncbi:MAG: type II toxin-antitoxin system HicB family antitoxin [Nitrospirae bacterium]|nr:type II toxin-antitoxin system HicB family antitoxin [Nitrospirota bacterium]
MRNSKRGGAKIRRFTLEYWMDDGSYVGRLKEVPGVFSQGETLAELEKNVRDAFGMMIEEVRSIVSRHVRTREIGVTV